MKSWILFLLAICQSSYQKSTPESNIYNAVVVEFGPQDPINSQSPVKNNSESFVSYIERAAKMDADIIVFPEDGLTSVNIPTKEELDSSWATLIPLDYTPCNNSQISVNEVLKILSCAAAEADIYLVINIAEKLPCDTEKNCPSYKAFYFNCQVVFDRKGKIIAKYRKFNLYSESQTFDSTDKAEIVTFDTDFGVTFGTFICFDILFKEPSLTLTRVHNVTDFVYSTAWFSELPFLTAIQVQTGFSYSEDVNLLAAGYNRAKFGNGGSGIYLGRSGLGVANSPSYGDDFLFFKVPKKNRKLLTNEIIKRENEKKLSDKEERKSNIINHDELKRRRKDINSIYNYNYSNNNYYGDSFTTYQDDMSKFKSIALNASMRDVLCDGDFCCSFDVEMSYVDPTSEHKFVVFNGVRTFPGEPVTIGIQTCGIVLCRGDNITSCGVKFISLTTFTSIKINTSFTNRQDLMVFPSSADIKLLPIKDWSYQEYYDDNKLVIEASMNSSVKHLLTCGIYGRKFDRDISPRSSSKHLGMEIATIFCLVLISIFFIILYRKGWKIQFRRNSSETEQYNQLQNK